MEIVKVAHLEYAETVSFGDLAHYRPLIADGDTEAWMMDTPEKIIPLKAGDMIALPPNQAHSFRTVGDQTMRLLGIHHSPERIVEYTEGESGPDGYPVVDN